jgi:hypothetical protein
MTPTDHANPGTVAVTLSARVADRLQRKADALGVPLDQYLDRLADQDTPPDEANAAWVARLEAWAASSPPRGVNLDDSRESIYEGRGE